MVGVDLVQGRAHGGNGGPEISPGGQVLPTDAGAALLDRGTQRPVFPAITHKFAQNDGVGRGECLFDGLKHTLLTPQILKTIAHQGKGIVVKAGPDMQAVLLDPLARPGVTAARTLAAQPPAHLIDVDVIGICRAGLRAQRLHCAKRADPAAQHRNPASCHKARSSEIAGH